MVALRLSARPWMKFGNRYKPKPSGKNTEIWITAETVQRHSEIPAHKSDMTVQVFLDQAGEVKEEFHEVDRHGSSRGSNAANARKGSATSTNPSSGRTNTSKGLSATTKTSSGDKRKRSDKDDGEHDGEETDRDLRKGADELKKQLEETTDPALRRKLKRMIKNRESAARSRARKVAYTAGLEDEVRHACRAGCTSVEHTLNVPDSARIDGRTGDGIEGGEQAAQAGESAGGQA
eukprot:scaffold1322_cov243-Prasinococcus_capsulatus_cf.AAC.2